VARLLFVVQDTFTIKEQGLILHPGLIPEREEHFRIGDPILLRRPDGTALKWQIDGLGLIHTPKPCNEVPVFLKGLSKDDVPAGTECWTIDAANSASLVPEQVPH
jgi:hypothetical protein